MTIAANATLVVGCVNTYAANETFLTSMTWAGTTMTAVPGVSVFQLYPGLTCYSLSSPTTGNQTLTINTTAGHYAGLALAGISFTGASGVVQNGHTTAGTNSNTDSMSLTTSSETGGMVVDSWTAQFTGGPGVIASGQTPWYNITTITGSNRPVAGSTKAGAASVTTSYTDASTGDNWAYGAFDVLPAATAVKWNPAQAWEF